MGAVLSAWLAEVAIISVRATKGQDTLAGLPLPSQYLATFAFYGVLGLVRKDSQAAKLAGALAWGMTVATLMNFYNPVNPTQKKGTTSTSTTATTSTPTGGITS